MENSTIQIPKDVIAPIVKNKIEQELISALGNKDQLIELVVGQIMNQKVDTDGRPSNYSSNKTMAEYIINRTINEASKEVMNEVIKENKDLIKKSIKKILQSQKGISGIAQNMVDAMTKGTEYRVTTHFTLKDVELF